MSRSLPRITNNMIDTAIPKIHSISPLHRLPVEPEGDARVVKFLEGLEDVLDVDLRFLGIVTIDEEFVFRVVVVVDVGLNIDPGAVRALGDSCLEGGAIVTARGVDAGAFVLVEHGDFLPADAVLDSLEGFDHHRLDHVELHVVREVGQDVLLALGLVFLLLFQDLVHETFDVDFAVRVLVHVGVELVISPDRVAVLHHVILAGAVKLEVPNQNLVPDAGDQTSSAVVGHAGIGGRLHVEIDRVVLGSTPADLVVQGDHGVTVQNRLVGSDVGVVERRGEGGREVVDRVFDPAIVEDPLQLRHDFVVADAEATRVETGVSFLVGVSVDFDFHRCLLAGSWFLGII